METATKAPKQCLVFTLNLCHVPLMERRWKKLTDSCSKLCRDYGSFKCPCFFHFPHVRKKEYHFQFTVSLTSLSLVRVEHFLLLFTALYTALCVWVCCCLSTPCSSVLTSKQYSCPRMLEWTGLMMASSSRVRSSASAALLGDSKDSWEWDSLKLCIKRVLEGMIVEEMWRGEALLLKVALHFTSVYKNLQQISVCQCMKIIVCVNNKSPKLQFLHIYLCAETNRRVSAAQYVEIW